MRLRTKKLTNAIKRLKTIQAANTQDYTDMITVIESVSGKVYIGSKTQSYGLFERLEVDGYDNFTIHEGMNNKNLQDIRAGLETCEADVVVLDVSGKSVEFLLSDGSYKTSKDKPWSIERLLEAFPFETVRMDMEALRTAISQACGSVGYAKDGGASSCFEDVLLDMDKCDMTIVATDSVRLGIKELVMYSGVKEPCEVKVSIKALAKLEKLLKGTGKVTLEVTDTHARFMWDDSIFVILKSDKTFPNYKQIIPKEHDRYAYVEVKALRKAIKGIKPFAKHNKHKSVFNFADELLIIATIDPLHKASKTLEVSKMEGEGIELAFNANYVEDFLSRIDSDKVRIGMTSNVYPSTWTAQNDESMNYILMPINL